MFEHSQLGGEFKTVDESVIFKAVWFYTKINTIKTVNTIKLLVIFLHIFSPVKNWTEKILRLYIYFIMITH